DGELRAALGQLTGAGLLFCRGVAPQSTYLFKHALIQDAAYETLLRTRRRELHRIAARTIVEEFPALADAQPAVVARHWTDAAEVNARARELAEKTGNLGRLVQQLYGAWTASIVAGTYASSIALSEQLRDAAQRDGSELSLGLAANAQFVTPQFRGEFVKAE